MKSLDLFPAYRSRVAALGFLGVLMLLAACATAPTVGRAIEPASEFPAPADSMPAVLCDTMVADAGPDAQAVDGPGARPKVLVQCRNNPRRLAGYRPTLLYDAAERLTRTDLERLQELSGVIGLSVPGTRLLPGTPMHKAQRWYEYQARQGKWRFERWSSTYHQNMSRARVAHLYADEYRDQLGWGIREYTVEFEDFRRVLDIADPDNWRGVEVKTGYVSLTADVAYEVQRDARLVAEGNWTMRWHVNGRMSEPLRKA